MSIKVVAGFTPKQISGCSLWFDGTDSSTITLSSGSLTQWNDKSGNGRNLTAVSGYANATVSSAFQNGLNVFNFSGNGLYRTAGGAVVYPQDCYIVVALKSTTAHVDVLGMGDTGNDNFNSLTFGEYSASRWHNGSSGFSRTPNCVSSTTETSTSFLLMQWSIANNNFLLRRNGVQLVQTASYTYGFSNSATSIFQIGFRHTNTTAANFSGYIGEIIVFNSQLGTTQQQQVESYLAQKWGLSALLPGGHPSLRTTIYRAPRAIALTMTPFFTAFSPRQISGCALWLDGADSSTILFSSGSNVSTWSDKSGNGRNATVYAGTPTYTSALGMTFNGSSSLQITYTASPILESMFVIIKFNSVSGQGDILSGTAAGQREYLMYVPYSPGTIYLGRHSTGPSGAINGGTVTTGSNYLLGYVFNGTGNTISFFQSGNTITSGTPQFTYSAGGTISVIGSYNGGGYLQGQIYEMIIYSTALSITERQRVESYLAQKWGLTSSLPGSHLHLTQPAGARTALSLANSKITITLRPILFLPTSIANIQMWMDGADPAGTGVIPSNGSVLSTWVDKSGKSYNATGVNSPTVVTNAVNSKSVVSYNGSSYSYATIASGIFSTAMNIFFVYKVNGGVSYMAPMTRGQGNNGSPIDQYNNVRYLGGGSYNNIQSAYSHASATSTTLFTQLIQQSPSTTYNEYVNGSTTASASGTGFSATDAASYVYIATRDDKVTSFNGYICELIVYNQMIGLTAQQKIEGYLAWKWGIQASLPGGHPYASAAP